MMPASLCRWADKMSSAGSDGKVRPFAHPFVQACFMFLGEMLCLVAFKALYYYYARRQVSVCWFFVVLFPISYLRFLDKSTNSICRVTGLIGNNIYSCCLSLMGN